MLITIKEAVERLNVLLHEGIEVQDSKEILEFVLKLQQEQKFHFYFIEASKYDAEYLEKCTDGKNRSAKEMNYEEAARYREEERICIDIVELINQKILTASTFTYRSERWIYYIHYGDSDTESRMKEIIQEAIKRNK